MALDVPVTTPDDVFRMLGGIRTSRGFLCRCPLPSHGKGRGDLHPSLAVSQGDTGRTLFHCFGGCDARAIRAFLGEDATRLAVPALPPVPRRLARPKTTTADALALWKAAIPVPGTPAEAYLSARGLPLPPPSLRFLARDSGPARRPYDVLIAAMQGPARDVVAVQLTSLHGTRPEKAPIPFPRIVVGPAIGAALRLGPAAETIGLAEGYETAHAAMLMFGLPVWASLGGSRLPMVEVPAGVRHVVVFADPDRPGALVAEAFRARHPKLEVTIRTPEGSDDYAAIDEARMRAERAAIPVEDRRRQASPDESGDLRCMDPSPILLARADRRAEEAGATMG